MGTWGVGPFENDNAQTMIKEITEDAEPAKIIERIFSTVIETGDAYLEAPPAQAAIGAAQILTLKKTEAEKTDVTALMSISHDLQNRFTQQARDALHRILTPSSELLELWEESKDIALWKETIEKLLEELK